MKNTELMNELDSGEYVSIFDRKPTNLEWVLNGGKPEVTPEKFGQNMNVEDLVAVHLTKYFPENETIRPLNASCPDYLRTTVHFAMNHPVSNIAALGNWDDTKYAIIAPLEKLCNQKNNQAINFNVVDTYFAGEVKLPAETTILVSSHAYDEAIKKELISRDLLMANLHSTIFPFDKLSIQKDNINYVLLGPNDNLREETYNEIARQGYLCMRGGSWNWDGSDGAKMKDQRRIADKIKAETIGAHSGNDIFSLEIRGGNIVADRDTEKGALSLLLRQPDEYGQYAGREYNAFERLEIFKKKLPTNCHSAIDKFIVRNMEIAKNQLSQESIEEHNLGYLFNGDNVVENANLG